jgi:hypothetical protein
LRDKFDVLIFVDGAIPALIASSEGRGSRGGATGATGDDSQPPAEDRTAAASEQNISVEFLGRRGGVTLAKTVPKLREFLEIGGTILTIGSSTSLGQHLGLPLANHLTAKDKDGKEQPLPREKFYVPGSVLRVRVDQSNPLAWGLGDTADVMFSASPTYRLTHEADGNGQQPTESLRPVAWFEGKTPLRSGWAWGQEHLADGVAIVEAEVGTGRLVMFGPQIAFRAQPHGTFKFLFNGIVQAGAKE